MPRVPKVPRMPRIVECAFSTIDLILKTVNQVVLALAINSVLKNKSGHNRGIYWYLNGKLVGGGEPKQKGRIP